MNQIALDEKISVLTAHKAGWARLLLSEKIALLHDLRVKTYAIAEPWVKAAVKAKGLEDQPDRAVEEWLGGPWAVLLLVNELIKTLDYIDHGQTRPLKKVRTRPDGQVIVDVFPLSATDRILFNGMRGEVWFEPGVTPANLTETMAANYKQAAPAGKVALVLAAGNVACIAVVDVLHKLFTEGQVCLLKMNPINDYLGVFYEDVFSSFCAAGYLQFAYGGADVGAYLSAHPDIDEIHMTGSARTHDAIVFGTGPDAAERKGNDQPVNTKRITSELGCVTPTIVVPGPWSAAELRYHAEHIASQKLTNGGFNCVSAQVLIMSAEWDRAADLLDSIRAVLRGVPQRPSYYPGTPERHQLVLDAHAHTEVVDQVDHTRDDIIPRLLVTGLDHHATGDVCFTQELFGSVLAETRLPGNGPAEFLEQAVRFANETLHGTLSANLIVHPQTAKLLGPALEQAIADLRYGSVSLNIWTAYNFLFPMLTWGAYPGHHRTDIQSGSGVVHNTFMFDRTQKSVLYAPFKISPKPAFVTHRNGDELGRRLTAFASEQSLAKVPAVLLAALKG